MHESNRCEKNKKSVGKAVIKGREMVGRRIQVRRRMALNETTEKGSRGWRIKMSSLTVSLARDITRKKNTHGSMNKREKGRQGKSRHSYHNQSRFNRLTSTLSLDDCLFSFMLRFKMP